MQKTELTMTSSSSSPDPPLTKDHCEEVLDPASDATDDIPERHSSSSSSGARSSDGYWFDESLEHRDSNNLRNEKVRMISLEYKERSNFIGLINTSLVN